jgi:hypothetical protein
MMRSMGEEAYREWYVQRVAETPIGLYLLCLAGNALLPGAVGAALIYFGSTEKYVYLVPVGIGTGFVGYSLAVLVFTLLSLWRGRRRARREGHTEMRAKPEAAPGPNLSA